MSPGPDGSGADASTGRPGPVRRLGVMGTLVWDRIHARDPLRAPVEEWGGVAYSLGAFAAQLPAGWEIVPILKVGRDLSEAALRYLRSLPGTDVESGVRIVPEPNNRVELRYGEGGRRTERLTGGVPPWSWPELTPVLEGCHALYLNFHSGFEVDLDTALALRAHFRGPIYADLHSLFFGMTASGLRVPQALPSWGRWLRCFDAVQVNEDEFGLLGRGYGDPWKLAADVVGPDLKVILVTLGTRGSAFVRGPGFDHHPLAWPESRSRMATPGTADSRRVPLSGGANEGDPTGCGDVWGATLLSRLLAGGELEAAMAEANAVAARNVTLRGAQGLHLYLRGRLTPTEELG